MKKSGKSILYLTTTVLIIVVIILIGIIINLLNPNKIEDNKKLKKEQLEETTTNNAYITLEAHNSELNAKQQEITNIQNLVGKVTVTADKILKDYVAYKDGKLIEGTMANNGALNATLNTGENFTIPAGYTDGGIIKTNSLESQTQANATASDILSGKTAWVNGSKITGTKVIESSTPTIVAVSQKSDTSSSSYTVTKNGYAILYGAGRADSSISVKMTKNGASVGSGSAQAYTVVAVNAGDRLSVTVTCSGGTKFSTTMIAVV